MIDIDLEDVSLFLLVGFSVLVFIISVMMLILFFMPCGIIHIGEGNTFGKMITYKEGIFKDEIWIRSDYESSQTYKYCVRKGTLKNSIIKNIKEGKRVELIYDVHLMGGCRNIVKRFIVIE